MTLLLELLIKSALIAALGLGLSATLSVLPARQRVVILRLTVMALLLLPLAAVAAPALELALLPAAPSPAVAPETWSGTVGPVAGYSVSADVTWPDPMTWVWLAIASGGAVVLGRFLMGVLALMAWSRGEVVRAPGWTDALSELAGARRPRLVASDALPSPLSWGLPPGVVLIGRDQLSKPELARAVIAHELAHIRHGDWLWLTLSRVALALFWINPLVWWVHAALADLSEQAADAEAARVLDPQSYARSLLAVAHAPHPIAALAMSGRPHPIKSRIKALMRKPTPARPLALAAAVAALAAVATPLAALDLTARQDQPAGTGPSRAAVVPVPPTPSAPRLISLAQVVRTPPAPPAPSAAPEAPQPPPALEAPEPPVPPAPPSPPEPPAPPADAGHWLASHQAEVRAHADAMRRHAAEVARHATALSAAERSEITRAVADARREAARAAAESIDAGRLAEEARAAAREGMKEAASQMRAGADHMRAESRRLKEPAYRAEQIRKAAERGQALTEDELCRVSDQLAAQARELDRQAARLAREIS